MFLEFLEIESAIAVTALIANEMIQLWKKRDELYYQWRDKAIDKLGENYLKEQYRQSK